MRVSKMIDNISLKVPQQDDTGFTGRLQDLWRRDIHTYSGHIQNMGVYKNLDGIIIHGSLAKYLNGENLTPLTWGHVKEAIRKLEVETGLDLSMTIVKSVEIGISIFTKEKPSEYLKLFGNPAIFTRREFSKSTGLETITYATKTGAFQFTGYDKIQEMKSRKGNLHLSFSNDKNVLRLEYKIVRRRGIYARFKRDLMAYDLFDRNIYRKLQGLFWDAYQAIPKLGRQCYFNKLDNITPTKWTEILAEQYRQICPKECLHLQQTLRESGALSDKSRERIRAEERRRAKDFSMSDKSPLVAELDELVRGQFVAYLKTSIT
ncbi:hypothetical protein LQZ21_13870 [Treponema sp. TIM-1]|uniref:hypothetical protein n=1 Tax=Treponema sp. TIM-1 TaxID=2898417 RepID=UPI00397EC049